MNQKSNWILHREGICYSIRLNEGETSIGRLSTCNIQLDSPFCSRQHCKIIINGANVTLKDCSSNGTFINEQRIVSDTISLKPMDRIGIGVFDVTPEELSSELYHIYILKNINYTENTIIKNSNRKSDIEINTKNKISKSMVRLKKENYIENKNIINPYNKIVTRSYKIKHMRN